MKRLAILIAAAILILAAFIIFLSPSKGPEKAEGPEVLASRRVRIDLEAMTGEKPAEPEKAPEKAPDAKPGPVKAAKAPESPAPAPPKKEPAAPEPVKKAPSARTASTRSEPAPSAAPPPGASVSSGSWAVNVASFRDPGAALKLRKRLRAAGYNAYTTEFTKGSTVWHRVRVGFYPTREKATSTGTEIARKFSVSQNPWVVRPTTSEISANSR